MRTTRGERELLKNFVILPTFLEKKYSPLINIFNLPSSIGSLLGFSGASPQSQHGVESGVGLFLPTWNAFSPKLVVRGRPAGVSR